MMINIAGPLQATWIFIAIILVAFLVTLRWRKSNALFPLSVTQELKGFAILAVVFSHIGYFLVSGQRFLFPLSIAAGIGVDLFLFLSGFGLTVGLLKRNQNAGQFYKQRLLKIFSPLWLVITVLFIADILLLKINYPWAEIWQSYIGYYPHADIYKNLNSPLWYITLILFYYLIFPWLFFKKRPWLSALMIALAGWLIVWWNPGFLQGVMGLYRVHYLAFPLGMLAGWLLYEPYVFEDFTSDKIIAKLDSIKRPLWLRNLLDLLKRKNIIVKTFYYLKKIKWPVYLAVIAGLIYFIGYYSYHSGYGHGAIVEQAMSLMVMAALVILFIIKKVESKFLYLFGFLSYEIYLLHWPLVYRYDIFYRYMPAWLATVAYLVACLILAYGLKLLIQSIFKRRNK